MPSWTQTRKRLGEKLGVSTPFPPTFPEPTWRRACVTRGAAAFPERKNWRRHLYDCLLSGRVDGNNLMRLSEGKFSGGRGLRKLFATSVRWRHYVTMARGWFAIASPSHVTMAGKWVLFRKPVGFAVNRVALKHLTVDQNGCFRVRQRIQSFEFRSIWRNGRKGQNRKNNSCHFHRCSRPA